MCVADISAEEEPDEGIMADYTVWVHTSNCQGAGTEGRVAIGLHGQGESSGMQDLEGAPFTRGKVTATSQPLARKEKQKANTSLPA